MQTLNIKIMGILDTTLQQLVEIDKNGFYSELIEKIKLEKSLGNLIRVLADKVNGLNKKKFQKEYVESLANEEIVALIRTLTKLDGNIKILTLGSTSPISSLVALLEERNYKDYADLVDWVFRNKTNDYLPFNSNKCWGVKSLKEYEDKR